LGLQFRAGRQLQPVEERRLSRAERIERAEAFSRSLGVNIPAGANTAFYQEETDTVHIPAFTAFKEPLFYYSVLSHETPIGPRHKTGCTATSHDGLASELYAMEELIAELGAAFLCLGAFTSYRPRTDHAP